jgi:hypothetical protein
MNSLLQTYQEPVSSELQGYSFLGPHLTSID